MRIINSKRINKIVTRGVLFVLVSVLFLGSSNGLAVAQGDQEEVTVHFFYSLTCPHCAQEKDFLKELQKEQPWLEVKEYEISKSSENRELLMDFYREYDVPQEEWGLVPILFTPQKYFLGFNQQTAQAIKGCIEECAGIEEGGMEMPETITIPLLGEFSLSGRSPLFLAVIMGALDGFNACAMTALGFLLTVLISTGVRKRVFWIGGTFILVSGLVYFVFIAASLNLFMVLEQTTLITTIVGIVISLFAAYLLKDYVHGVICKLCQTDPEKQNFFVKWEQRLFKKMQEFSQSDKSLPLLLIGVAVVAAGINLVELACSFGFPLAFTKILTSMDLPTTSYYFYLLVYIIFYMIDDFIIFTIAVVTLEVSQVAEKYLKTIKLISALVLLGLGIVMIIRPELLALG